MKTPKVTLAFRPEFNSFIEELNNFVDAYELMPEHYVYHEKEIPSLLNEKDLIAHTFQLCAGNEALFEDRITKIKNWNEENNILAISDHLAANFINGIEIDNFYPIDLRNSEKVEDNIDILEKHFSEVILENPAVPFFLGGDFLKEAKLLKDLHEKKGIQILLDINNLYINSKNFNFNPSEYLEVLPADGVRIFHLAGFDEHEDWLIDSHMNVVNGEVWDLCALALKKFNPEYIVLERDHFKGDIMEIINELKMIKSII